MNRDRRLSGYAGKIVVDFNLREKVLEFTFSDGSILNLYAQGEEFSYAWFSELHGKYALEPGSRLYSLEFKYLESRNNDKSRNKDKYGIKVITSNGHADIDMFISGERGDKAFISINEDDIWDDARWDSEA